MAKEFRGCYSICSPVTYVQNVGVWALERQSELTLNAFGECVHGLYILRDYNNLIWGIFGGGNVVGTEG